MQICQSDRTSMLVNPYFLRLILVMIILVFLPGSSQAQYGLDINMTCSGQNDTIWAGESATFDIYIENGTQLRGVDIGFRLWSDDGATWAYENVGGYGTKSALSVAPGCRMDPPSSVWDLGIFIYDASANGLPPDSLGVAGVSMFYSMAAGPLEHMMSFHFIANDPGPDVVTLCMDTVSIPVNWYNRFIDMIGQAHTPTTYWPYGGTCWPVKARPNLPPEFTNCPFTTIAIDYQETFDYDLEAIDPEEQPLTYNIVYTNGYGMATIDPGAGILVYQPVPEDSQSMVEIVVEVCDEVPQCTECAIFINVTAAPNLPPDFTNCPSGPIEINYLETFVYTFEAIDPEGQPLTYNIVDLTGSGSYTFDPSAGMLQYQPIPEDTLSPVEIVIEVCDGVTPCTECAITLYVTSPVPVYSAGDSNGDGAINVGDAVHLINYVFKSGPAPVTLIAGDANCDLILNVGDAVYLINYVFKAGPTPGCLGACCLLGGECIATTAEDCMLQEGTYAGISTTCDEVVCYSVCCAITMTPTPPAWIPTGRAVGTNPGDPGNSVTYTATVTDDAPRVIRFMLSDVSTEPGVCLNYGTESETDKDLKFIQTATVNPASIFDPPSADGQTIQTKVPVTTAQVTVTSYDYGAYGKIQACCLYFDDCEAYSTKFKVPVDDNSNHVADAAAQNTGPGASSAGTDDNETVPAGDGVDGDNLPRYEEYRGYMVQTVHTRTDVEKKDVFIRNIDVDDAGLSGYFTTATLTTPVHVILSTEWQSATRVVNFNFKTDKLSTTQQAIKVTDAGASADGYWGWAQWLSNPACPNKQLKCFVYTTTIKGGGALTAAIDATTNTIPIGNTNGWRTSGTTKIGAEQITYIGKTATSLTGAVRAPGAVTHLAGAKVDFFINPVDFIKRTFAHEAGHIVNLQDTHANPKACDGVDSHIMSEYSCKGGIQGVGYWIDFTGTKSAIPGFLRIND
ncbi:MAG: hypothetical protein GY841_03210 [FCB group bacterium]|nr:hypothetical protein [FCB group bacterium]